MKIKIKYWLAITAISLFLISAFSSCVKDRNISATDFSKTQPIVELVKAGNVALAFDRSPDPSNVDIIVNLAGPSVADRDIEVTLAPDPAGMAALDSALTILPDSAYSLSGLKVTIPKGQRTGKVTLTIFTTKVDLSLSNALAFKIVDAQGILISANSQSVVYPILVKNQYDGAYTVTGWFFHPAAGRAIDATKSLNTVGLIRVEGGAGDLGSPFQFDVVGDMAVNWASDAFTSSGFMTADNPGGVDYSSPTNEGHTPGDAEFNSTIYNNTYDPATKTFWLHYGYVNGIVGDQSAYSRQIYEKWVKD